MSPNTCRHQTCGTVPLHLEGPRAGGCQEGKAKRALQAPKHREWDRGQGARPAMGLPTDGAIKPWDGSGGKDPTDHLITTPCHGWDASHKVRHPVMALAPLLLSCCWLLSLLHLCLPRNHLVLPQLPSQNRSVLPQNAFLHTFTPPSLWGARLPSV